MQEKLGRLFRVKLKSIEYTRIRIEGLYARNDIVMRDVSILYEGLFLRLITSFEAFLEELFFKILLGKSDYPTRYVKPRINFRSANILRDVLMQNQNYLEWLPYNKTLTRANSFLRGGRPFTCLTDSQKSKIKEAIRVRNCVAHSSEFSRSIFKKKVIINLILSPKERTPAGFLRSLVRINPPLCRFQLYISNLSRMSYDLTKK